MRRREHIQVETADLDQLDEREQLHEPADQISLDSFDTIDLVDGEVTKIMTTT